MLQTNDAKEWYDEYGKHIDRWQEILDIYSMYLWSSECLPYQDLIRMLKQESGSTNSLYQIACFIQEFNKDR